MWKCFKVSSHRCDVLFISLTMRYYYVRLVVHWPYVARNKGVVGLFNLQNSCHVTGTIAAFDQMFTPTSRQCRTRPYTLSVLVY